MSIYTNNNLVVRHVSIMFMLDIIALCGGKFGSLRIIATFFFAFFMPQLKGLNMLEAIGEKRQSANTRSFNEISAKNKKLVAAQTVMGRKRITSTCWQRTLMSIEGLLKNFCLPKSSFTKEVS